ncbi:MAG TPA: heavy metal-binding domain-containing protein [Candidatus Elarobacter sp.]|jgi:uncharacterized protein YbjQ (UPF0145 family)|nr:heavy metal-binding domain-containing protein [Candidatus Elarobacter sp.]
MSFFGIGQGRGPQQSDVRTTQGGVPLDAVTRLRRMRGEGGPPLFTSDLSVSEFVLLEQMQWRPLGLVLGSSIYHVGIQYGNFYQNQELQYLSAAMYEARELAMSRMEEEADVLGADGIVGVRLEVGGYDWAENALEFTAIGTAVKAPGGGTTWRTRDGKPFTSDFSTQDFYKLVTSTGYVPRELVLGNCVYHIAHQGFMQQMRNLGANVELNNYTEAIYEARELAMSRMQSEAESHGADGIVGMQIVEKTHIWSPHVIEFMAIGTSVEKRGEPKQVPLTFQVSLDD